MAAVVDKLNAGDPLYENMTGHFSTSATYKAACDLMFKELAQPSGYTEPLLHAWRLKVKAGGLRCFVNRYLFDSYLRNIDKG